MPQEFLENIRTLDRCQDWATRYPQNALVVLVDNQAIGFVCYGVSNQADLENAGELYALYVLADYYGKDWLSAHASRFEKKCRVLIRLLSGY